MRFIDLGGVSPEFSVCADRAVFESHSSGFTENTLHVYARDRPCISLGRFQTIGSVKNKENISIVRRMSGGSSIYSDEFQMTYAVTLKRADLPAARELSFKIVCSGLIEMFKHLGIKAEYKPINDVLVNNKKISGSAQFRDKNSIMQHGSIILKIDPKTVDERLISKERSYNGLTSLEDVLGTIPERDTIIKAMIKGFEETFNEPILKGELTPKERYRIEELMRDGNYLMDAVTI